MVPTVRLQREAFGRRERDCGRWRTALFCAVIDGVQPAEVVLDDEVAVGFLDHRPVFKGHVLVVPRDHVVTLADLPADGRRTALPAGATGGGGRAGRAERPTARSWP